MKNKLLQTLSLLVTFMAGCVAFTSCEEQKEHTAAAIRERDSVAVMTSYGVNTLISDSGVIKYRIVAERWEVNENINPSRWIMNKGVFMTQFDEKFHVQSYIQADTAYHYDKKKLWELRGRVRILTKEGLKFFSEELYWDEAHHQFYSNKFSRLITPERTLQGAYFRSDEQMTRYYVSNTKGSFERADLEGDEETETNSDNTQEQTDSAAQIPLRMQAQPQRRTTTNAQ
ncbi:MAG: LPS export ABC transporter periplasmic protein LptC [Prevotella sp.]|nr:LPS export ABC transporter periplasmic protein LptC [Prevotella sp.]